jgi:hypothetical protein
MSETLGSFPRRIREIMKFLIRSLAIVIAAVLAIGTPATAAPAHYTDGITASDGQLLIMVSEGGRPGETNSMLAIQPPGVGEGETRDDWIQCKDTNDPVCATNDPKKDLLGWSVLPHCSIATSSFCLESVQFGTLELPMAPATYLGAAKTGMYATTIPRDERRNYIEGGTISLFEAPGINHAGGTANYGVAVRLSQHYDYNLRKYVTFDMTASVIPYLSSNLDTTCAFRDGDACAAAVDFAEGTRVALKFRVPTTIGGWFSGRMKAPDLAVTSFAPGINTISISAQPVAVSAMALVRDRKSFTSKETMWLNNNGRWGFKGGTATGANPSQGDIFEFVDFYRPLVGDTAAGTDTVWNMSTRGSGGGSYCLEDTSKVLGIVTTNALGYSGESPEFRGGFLNYKVAGLHYQSDRETLVQGSYDLVMRSETARCLYGFSNAPLSATISVTGGADKTIATTVVSEKNGWLKMAAYGFTFSNKTIKVKVTKAKPKAPKKTKKNKR